MKVYPHDYLFAVSVSNLALLSFLLISSFNQIRFSSLPRKPSFSLLTYIVSFDCCASYLFFQVIILLEFSNQYRHYLCWNSRISPISDWSSMSSYLRSVPSIRELFDLSGDFYAMLLILEMLAWVYLISMTFYH